MSHRGSTDAPLGRLQTAVSRGNAFCGRHAALPQDCTWATQNNLPFQLFRLSSWLLKEDKASRRSSESTLCPSTDPWDVHQAGAKRRRLRLRCTRACCIPAFKAPTAALSAPKDVSSFKPNHPVADHLYFLSSNHWLPRKCTRKQNVPHPVSAAPFIAPNAMSQEMVGVITTNIRRNALELHVNTPINARE